MHSDMGMAGRLLFHVTSSAADQPATAYSGMFMNVLYTLSQKCDMHFQTLATAQPLSVRNRTVISKPGGT